MAASQRYPFISPDECLAAEDTSAIKHEYFDGDGYAMAGASDAYLTILLNGGSLLKSHLRGTSCRVFRADMKADQNQSS